MPLSISDTEVLRRALESRCRDVWTSFPAVILSYDASTQTVDVQPQIRGVVPSDDGFVTEDLPVLPDIPVAFPRGFNDRFAITWPLAPGDHVWVHVCTLGIGGWRRTGDLSDPGDIRTHSLGNAFAIPGAAPSAQTLDQATINALIVEGSEIRLGKGASDFAALAALVDANFQAIKDMFTGWVPVPNDGGAALKTASATLTFQGVAASKVKVE